jgi:hypothetical protein
LSITVSVCKGESVSHAGAFGVVSDGGPLVLAGVAEVAQLRPGLGAEALDGAKEAAFEGVLAGGQRRAGRWAEGWGVVFGQREDVFGKRAL